MLLQLFLLYFIQSITTLLKTQIIFLESYPKLENSFGMHWRFAPMADPYVDEWHSRDLDATMLQRELDAVREWRSTSLGFHIMRDHPYHGTAILGGMFGIRQDSYERKKLRLKEFTKIITDFGREWKKGADQSALSAIVAPHVGGDSLVHDSYLCTAVYLTGTHPVAFPSKRPDPVLPSEIKLPNFVGNRGNDQIDKECPVECRPVDHKDWKFC